MTSSERRAYRLLLCVFPERIRRQFGADMERMFAAQLDDARRTQGAVRVWAAATMDALRHGGAERLHWVPQTASAGTHALRRWRWWMHAISQDVRYALRMLMRQPGVTVISVLTLALGIGANTAIFSAVNALLLRPLPYPNPDRVMTIWESRTAEGVADNVVSPADFLDWAKMNQSFSAMAAHTPIAIDVTGAGDPVRLFGAAVSPAYFDVFGTRMQLGRAFRPDEVVAGKHRVTILSHPVWVERFGSNPGIIGQTIQLSGVPHEVVGVLPADFEFPEDSELFVPLSFRDQVSRTSHFLFVYGRLADGVSLQQARADMERLGQALQQSYPDENRGHGASVIPMNERLKAPLRTSLLLLLAAVGFVLLIACVNIANLLLARTATRTRELAVRAAVGAGRKRIVGQMLTESVVLALLGGATGLAVASAAIGALRALRPEELPLVNLAHLRLEPRVLLFTLGVSVVTGIMFGLLPAFAAARGDLHVTLKDAGRAPSGVRRRLRTALVVSEVALASLLLLAAGLTIRSFQALVRSQPGFSTEGALTFAISLPAARYADANAQARVFEQIENRVAALPGVRIVGATTHLPLSSSDSRRGVVIEGREPTPDSPTRAHVRSITPGYLPAMGMTLKTGRHFTEADTADSPLVVLVNETMAKRYWPSEESPVGKRVMFTASDQWRTIVGVYADVRFWGFTAAVNPEMYLPDTQYPGSMRTFVVRTQSIDPVTLAPSIRAQVREVDPNLPVSSLRTIEEVTARSIGAQRSGMWLLLAFGAVAVVLAAAGIYGVMSHMVALRTPEIGIRMTLGAQPSRMMALILREGVIQALAGLAVGLSAGVGVLQSFRALLYGVQPSDPVTIAAVAMLLLATALIACLVPARRAMRVDPMQALRT